MKKTKEELRQEIYDYFYNLVLNSNNEEWDEGYLIRDNTKVHIEGPFRCEIYTDKTLATRKDYIHLNLNWVWNRTIRKKNLILSKRYKEIRDYYYNKEAYNEISELYNLLPVREQRKKKLENLEDSLNSND